MIALTGLTTLARLFSLQACAKSALGKPAEAFRDQWVVHRLAEARKSSDILVATMIRVALLGLNAQTYWEG